jgi:hypothetical protein
MSRGPLPQPQRRRTNAPAIPTTNLPAAGRSGPAPELPPGVELGTVGRAWYDWAWATPQAAAWASGHEGIVARRASLEDDLAALRDVEGLDFAELIAESATASKVDFVVRRVAGLATGRLQILKAMLDLDDRLGLTPKAMAALRWSIADGPAEPAKGEPGPTLTVVPDDRWRRTGSA